MTDDANFANDDHALVTGILIGLLMKSGIPATPVRDERGDYIPRIRVRIDTGHSRLVDVELEVRAVADDE